MTASVATALTSLLMEHVPRDLEDATATSRRFMLAVFVVGYGLDYDERYRNLDCIATLAPHVYAD